jgi:4-hydroxybutyrate dehydrogenase
MRPMLQLPKLLLDFGAISALPNELAQLGVRNPLLISDAGIAACGVLAHVQGAAQNIKHVFATVTESPIFSDCDSAANSYRAGGCDGIVAVGGGSVIDAAKVTAVIAGHGGRAADYVAHPVTHRVVPLIVVPTTSGTGSEASPAAGVHPDSSSPALPIRSPHLIPKVAICDPDLTMTLPRQQTAVSGIDALTHCIEGYLSTSVSPPADTLALDGIGRIWRHLERATLDGTDRDARWHMMMGAFEGGAAMSKGLGPAHSIAIACGDQGVPHGILSAIGLLASLPMVSRHCEQRLQKIAAVIDLSPGQTVLTEFQNMMRGVGLPLTLREAGYQVDDIDKLAYRCAASHFNSTSPYLPTVNDFRASISTVAG